MPSRWPRLLCISEYSMAHFQVADLLTKARLAQEPCPPEFYLRPGQVLLVGRSRHDARRRLAADDSETGGEIRSLIEHYDDDGVDGAIDRMLEFSDGHGVASEIGAVFYFTRGRVPLLHVCSFAADPGRVQLQPYCDVAHPVYRSGIQMPGISTVWLNTGTPDAPSARLGVIDAAKFTAEEEARRTIFARRLEDGARNEMSKPHSAHHGSRFNPPNRRQLRGLVLRASDFLRFPAVSRSPTIHILKSTHPPDRRKRNKTAVERVRTAAENFHKAVNDASESRTQGLAGSDLVQLFRYGFLEFGVLASILEPTEDEPLFRSYGPDDREWQSAIAAMKSCRDILRIVELDAQRMALPLRG